MQSPSIEPETYVRAIILVAAQHGLYPRIIKLNKVIVNHCKVKCFLNPSLVKSDGHMLWRTGLLYSRLLAHPSPQSLLHPSDLDGVPVSPYLKGEMPVNRAFARPSWSGSIGLCPAATFHTMRG